MRRDAGSMPAFRYEYELAQKDGVTFLWNTQPLEILERNSAVHGLRCLRTRVVGNGRRAQIEAIPGSEFTLDVDMVVKALGQQPMTDLVKSIHGLQLNAGRVVINHETHQTGNPKYFAGGDCVNGGKEVVDAVADGMAAARGIHRAVSGRP